MGSKNHVLNAFGSCETGLLHKNQVRITSESYLRLTLGTFEEKPWKWDVVRSKYVLKLRQDCVRKITLD